MNLPKVSQTKYAKMNLKVIILCMKTFLYLKNVLVIF